MQHEPIALNVKAWHKFKFCVCLYNNETLGRRLSIWENSDYGFKDIHIYSNSSPQRLCSFKDFIFLCDLLVLKIG
jgi:hypothetical protein